MPEYNGVYGVFGIWILGYSRTHWDIGDRLQHNGGIASPRQLAKETAPHTVIKCKETLNEV